MTESTKVIRLGCRPPRGPHRDAFFAEAYAARDARRELLRIHEDYEQRYRDGVERLVPGLTAAGRRFGRVKRIVERVTSGRELQRKARLERLKPVLEQAKSLVAELRKLRDAHPDYKDLQTALRLSEQADVKLAYQTQRNCHWGSWNAQVDAHKKAVAKVLSNRKSGVGSKVSRKLPEHLSIAAQVQRSHGQDWNTITQDDGKGQFRMVLQRETTRGGIYTARLRARDGYVDTTCNLRGWALPKDARVTGARLVATRAGYGWRWHLCITVVGSWPQVVPEPGSVVGLDWGHREYPDGSVRAYVYAGSDNAVGEVRLPPTVRVALDRADETRSDRAMRFNAVVATIGDWGRSRSEYKLMRYLRRLGVRTAEQQEWMTWERKARAQEDRLRRKAYAIRQDLYRKVGVTLSKYEARAYEKISKDQMKALDKAGESARRKRTNRDLVAASEFERWCPVTLTVPARNTSKRCNCCDHINDIGSAERYACAGCGVVHDRDVNAARNIRDLALAKPTVSNENHRAA